MVVLAGAVVLDEVAFRAWFETDYLRWYLANGFVISLVFGFVTLAWGDLNKMTHLISAHPLEYAAAWLRLGGLPPTALATVLRPAGRPQPPDPASETADVPADAEVPTGLWVDGLLTAFFAVSFVVACFAWLLVAVPLQYFIYLLTGAPAREAYTSRVRVWFRLTPMEFHIEEALKADRMPDNATESGFFLKPVSFTAAITAAVLFAVSKVL